MTGTNLPNNQSAAAQPSSGLVSGASDPVSGVTPSTGAPWNQASNQPSAPATDFSYPSAQEKEREEGEESQEKEADDKAPDKSEMETSDMEGSEKTEVKAPESNETGDEKKE